MAFEVRIDTIEQAQWEEYASQFADYSIYQTWAYQEVCANLDGHKVSRAVIQDEKKNIVAMTHIRIRRVMGFSIGYILAGPLFLKKDGTCSCSAEVVKALRDAYLGSRVNVLRIVPSIIDDPENNPFRTPSGKIEIYSQQIADMNNPLIPPVAQYIEPWEGPKDPLREKYPLQLLTNHWKGRANCQYANIPWLKEHSPQALHINTRDAKERGIQDGDRVRVFNDRGETIIPAAVTERMMPGAVILPFGTWYDPDAEGYVVFAANVMKLGGAATLVILALVLGVLWARDRTASGDEAMSGEENAKR